MEKKPTRTQVAVIVTSVLEGALLRKRAKYVGVTFFAKGDTWVYHGVFDERFCPLCQDKAVPFTYSGLHLRREFPWLMISSEDRIEARVHMPRDDNCRCWLSRSGASDEALDKQEAKFDVRLERVSDSDAVIDSAVAKFKRGKKND
jgi:hypothetical protein